jgi:hypothetical protein
MPTFNQDGRGSRKRGSSKSRISSGDRSVEVVVVGTGAPEARGVVARILRAARTAGIARIVRD